MTYNGDVGRKKYIFERKMKHMKKQVKVVVVDDNEAVIRSVKDYFKDSENAIFFSFEVVRKEVGHVVFEEKENEIKNLI